MLTATRELRIVQWCAFGDCPISEDTRAYYDPSTGQWVCDVCMRDYCRMLGITPNDLVEAYVQAPEDDEEDDCGGAS